MMSSSSLPEYQLADVIYLDSYSLEHDAVVPVMPWRVARCGTESVMIGTPTNHMWPPLSSLR